MTITGITFMLAFIGALLTALWRKPIVGLFAYVAVFYLHPPSRWWGEFLPDLRWSFTAGVITFISMLLHHRRKEGDVPWIRTPLAKIMILFVLWFWLTSFWALSPQKHHTEAIMLTKYLLVSAMIYTLVDTPGKMMAFLMAHVIGCLYLGVLGYTAGASGRLDGVGGPGIDDSNTLGMQEATGVIVAGALALHFRWWRLAICLIGIAFALNAIILTQSRGAFLAMLGGGLMLALLRPPKYRKLFLGFAALGVVAIGAVASQQFWDRLATVQETVRTTDEENREESAQSRIWMLRGQAKMAADYPFGSGHRGSEVLSTTYVDSRALSRAFGVRSSHNVFMTVLVEQGIPGVLLSFLLIGWTVRSLLQCRARAQSPEHADIGIINACIGGALTVVLVGGLFADFAHCEVQIWMLSLLAALRYSRECAEPQADSARNDQRLPWRAGLGRRMVRGVA